MSNDPAGNFEFDFGDFDRRFAEYALNKAPDAAEKGMWEALRELKNDCDTVYPKTPHLEGNLRGDYTLVLEGVTQKKVVENTGGKGKSHRTGITIAEELGRAGLAIICKLIFRMPYAARWHEAIDKEWAAGGINWSESGVGPKYAERKLQMFMRKYIGMAASRVRELGGG
jgi:hypothetical protein